jgi:hypothetical protein
VDDRVILKPNNILFTDFGDKVGQVEEVFLVGMGCWEVAVDYLIGSITVDSRLLAFL